MLVVYKSLERDIFPLAKAHGDFLVLAAAWSQDPPDPGSPFLRLAGPQGKLNASDVVSFTS